MNAAARGADILALATAGAPEGECWTCRAVGPAIADVCRDRKSTKAAGAARLGQCLGTAIDSLNFRSDLAYGAGMACPHPGASPAFCARVADAMPEPLALAFRAGMEDPLAGADHPFLALRSGEK